MGEKRLRRINFILYNPQTFLFFIENEEEN